MLQFKVIRRYSLHTFSLVLAAIPIQHSTMLQSNPKMRKLPRHLFRIIIAGHTILHDALLLPIFAILLSPSPSPLLQRGVFTVQSLREGEGGGQCKQAVGRGV